MEKSTKIYKKVIKGKAKMEERNNLVLFQVVK